MTVRAKRSRKPGRRRLRKEGKGKAGTDAKKKKECSLRYDTFLLLFPQSRSRDLLWRERPDANKRTRSNHKSAIAENIETPQIFLLRVKTPMEREQRNESSLFALATALSLLSPFSFPSRYSLFLSLFLSPHSLHQVSVPNLDDAAMTNRDESVIGQRRHRGDALVRVRHYQRLSPRDS